MAYAYSFGMKSGHEMECPEDQRTKEILGGKGWGLAAMSGLGLPVPPGLTITTRAHHKYQELSAASSTAMKHGFVAKILEKYVTPTLDQIEDELNGPALWSVRSGAPVSMPGMMDTILNVGLTSQNVGVYAHKIGEWAAYDSYRRLIQMMGSTAFGVDHSLFENELAGWRDQQGVETDAELTVDTLKLVVKAFLQIFEQSAGEKFPDTLEDQMRAAICTVFDSWDLPRAKHYRKMEGISDTLGTAVNIQRMVFGNLNKKSGSGVFFTRDPNSGHKSIYGEFLVNAQGEDVVAGIRTPVKIGEMEKMEDWKHIVGEILKISETLEVYYRDMVDCEFTVEDGKLFMLQSRSGKRTSFSAVVIAMDLVKEGLIDLSDISTRVTPKQFQQCLVDYVDPKYSKKPVGMGIPACSGVAVGKIALTADQAVEMKLAGEKPILVAKETTPDDIHGMEASVGILTQTGGTTSHAAVVARSMNRPCVVGLTTMKWQSDCNVFFNIIGEVEQGTPITIDGATGKVWLNDSVPVLSMKDSPVVAEFEKMVLKGNDSPYLYEPDVEFEPHDMLWFSAMQAGTANQLMEAVNQIKPEGPFVLDFRTPEEFYEEYDVFLHTNIFLYDREFGPLDMDLLDADLLKNAHVFGDRAGKYSKIFAKAGAKVQGEAQTVEDLLTGVGTYMKPDVVEKVFGSTKMMDEVLKKFEVSVVSMNKQPVAKGGAVLQALSSKE